MNDATSNGDRRVMLLTPVRSYRLEAFRAVPRHLFGEEKQRGAAYGDHPLPSGEGQTISQPYMVALMTQCLEIRKGARILEVGTGCGYQAAILGEIVAEVYTVEIIEALAIQARERLARLGCGNVRVRCGDGYFGWEEHAPYDAIVVTAAAREIPPPLLAQLKDGGKLVVPVGPPGGYQTLWEISKKKTKFNKRNVTGVLFVPLTGDHALVEG